GWYSKENFIGLNNKTVRSYSAYKREHLVETFLGFLKPYKGIENMESCKQKFDVKIAIFLDTFLDRVETTDNNEIENHWRLIKHDYLSEYNRVRLDLLAYIIVTQVIPGQVDQLQQLRDENLFLTVLNKLLTEYMLDEKALVNDNFDEQSSDYDTSNKEALELINHKKELYSLMKRVKSIIEENTQNLNADK
ncbi:10531_t:CDS:2, partial [Dentiscutata erythropus]